jgi:hypothetical protein
MTSAEFIQSIENDPQPASDLGAPLRALWLDAKGDWDRAHEACQEDEGSGGAWVHAYLHRKEGDEGNASYWYSRAGRKKPSVSLDEEWRAIVDAMLT